MRKSILLAVVGLLTGAAAFPALADLMKIVEIFPGTAASPNAQYIVIQMYASGQNQVGGESITLFDAAGNLTSTVTFPGPVSNGASQDKILIATTEAESFFGLSADLIMPASVLSAGGKACWAGTVDCVAWGSYSGATTGVGEPYHDISGLVSGKAAIRRLDRAGLTTVLDAGDDTDNSYNDFFDGLPAPRNNARILGTTPASTCGNGVLEGLEECDDHNLADGDGCSSTCKSTPVVLSIADAAIVEGNSGTKTMTFTVTLSSPLAVDVTYDIATADRVNTPTTPAATAGSDYVASSLTDQVIPAGQTSKTFSVPIIGDTVLELNETFAVNLGNVARSDGLPIGVGDSQAIGTIIEDDQPVLSINDVSMAEGNSGTQAMTFTVSLSVPSSSPVTYDIATGIYGAQPGVDFVAKSLTGETIPAGQTSKTFTVTINGDQDVEPDEGIEVTLSNASGAAARNCSTSVMLGDVKGWCFAYQRVSPGCFSSKGKSTTHKNSQADSSINCKSCPNLIRKAPSASFTTTALSAPKNSKSPAVALVRVKMAATASSLKNFTIGDCSPALPLSIAFTLM